MNKPTGDELVQLEQRRAELRGQYLLPAAQRPATSGRGIHHAALICRDVEQTIQFYQELIGFPLVELMENRDYKGSTHLFFDIGNDNLLAFFDFPGLDLGPYQEVLGGHHRQDALGIQLRGVPPPPAVQRRQLDCVKRPGACAGAA